MGTNTFVPSIGTMFKSLYSNKYALLTSWLKQQREAKGLSMRDLAPLLDVPHSFIGKVEQGERRLDIVEYIQYCEALEADPLEGLRLVTATPE